MLAGSQGFRQPCIWPDTADGEPSRYSGTLRGDDLTWRRDGHRAEDSPLKLARRKAQRLAGKLQDELIRWAQETGAEVADVRAVVPFVQEAVFLHHPGLRCLLPAASRIDLFGLDDARDSGLPGISERLLEPATPQQSVGVNREEIIAALIERIGIVLRRQREAGTWVIDEEPLGEGEGWQDWPAFHRVATTERGRIRFLVTPPGATTTERARIRQVAACGGTIDLQPLIVTVYRSSNPYRDSHWPITLGAPPIKLRRRWRSRSRRRLLSAPAYSQVTPGTDELSSPRAGGNRGSPGHGRHGPHTQ